MTLLERLRSVQKTCAQYVAGSDIIRDAADRLEQSEKLIDELESALELSMDNLRSHGDNCFVSDNYEGDPGAWCNCGRDGLVNYLEEALASAKLFKEGM